MTLKTANEPVDSINGPVSLEQIALLQPEFARPSDESILLSSMCQDHRRTTDKVNSNENHRAPTYCFSRIFEEMSP